MDVPPLNWAHAGPSALAGFLASLVEFVEALTVVLAVGSVRGWPATLSGSGAALGVLLLIILTVGTAMTRIPLDIVRVVVGGPLLLFGMRWLRKAILRSAGVIPLHDEEALFAQETRRFRELGGGGGGWDRVAVATSFQITMIEGIEVVFIVVAIGAGAPDLLASAGLGALAALLVVIALGVAVHRPLARVPENTLKFAVGILLSAFGGFWMGEGMGVAWPGDDWSILGLIAGFLGVAWLTSLACARATGRAVGGRVA